MKIILFVLSMGLLAALVACSPTPDDSLPPTPTRLGVYQGEPNATPWLLDSDEQSQVIRVTAESLFAAYQSNKFQADKRYKFRDNGGDLLRVSGVVGAVEKDYMAFAAGSYRDAIQCYYKDDSLRLAFNVGNTAEIVGRSRGEGLLGQVVVEECVLPPPPPTPTPRPTPTSTPTPTATPTATPTPVGWVPPTATPTPTATPLPPTPMPTLTWEERCAPSVAQWEAMYRLSDIPGMPGLSLEELEEHIRKRVEAVREDCVRNRRV